MKMKILACAAALSFIAMPAIAADAEKALPPAPGGIQTDEIKTIAISSKVPFKLYGFVSAEMMWADSQLSSFGTLNNDPASWNRNMAGFNRVVDESVASNNDAFISGTPQNSRIGFMLDPYDFGGKSFTVDGRIEMDFFSGTNMSIGSIAPRLRRAYAGIGQTHWRVLVGQEWELFSPLNTATLNIGSNLWTQGNLGFRRPQVRATYMHGIGEGSGMELAASANLPSNVMTFNDSGNTTCVPMMEGSFGYYHKLPAGKLWAYISGLYARHNNATVGASDVNNWGVAASLEVPVHKFFKPSAEFQYGYSLGTALSISQDNRRQRSISGWGQIKSNWLKWLETNVGYGVDDAKGSEVPAGWVKRNQMGFANLMFKPHEQFVIGLEYNYLRTTYQGTGASEGNAVFTNVLFYF